jgi:hypothetical protein
MNASPNPGGDRPEAEVETVANQPASEVIDRRATLVTVAKYSAPLIAALLPEKARAFSF